SPRVPTREPGEEGVAVDLEGPGIRLARGARERVDRFADHHVDEAALLEHPTPARPGQPAGDSTGPEVDVLGGGLRYRPPVGDVGELQPAAGPEHPPDLAEHGALVRAQVDDA